VTSPMSVEGLDQTGIRLLRLLVEFTKQRLSHIPNLILLDSKFPRQTFYFAKRVFPFSDRDAVFTSRFFRKYHELPH
jgi:hypothetical protein